MMSTKFSKSQHCKGVVYSYLSAKELAGTIAKLSKSDRSNLLILKDIGRFRKLVIGLYYNQTYIYEKKLNDEDLFS